MQPSMRGTSRDSNSSGRWGWRAPVRWEHATSKEQAQKVGLPAWLRWVLLRPPRWGLCLVATSYPPPGWVVPVLFRRVPLPLFHVTPVSLSVVRVHVVVLSDCLSFLRISYGAEETGAKPGPPHPFPDSEEETGYVLPSFYPPPGG